MPRDTNPKTEYGVRKPSMFYTPPLVLFEMGMVYELGANKYGPFNWRVDPVSISTYYDAAQRHMSEFRDGRWLDPESQRPVLAHTMACCGILIDAHAHGTLIDDRGKVFDQTGRFIETINRERQPK